MTTLPPPNRIPLNEWLTKCESFFNKYPQDSGTPTMAEIKEMFTLHNDKLLPRETGMYCSSCCNRVYKRLKEEYKNKQ